MITPTAKAVRAAVVARLVAADLAFGANVFPSRQDPIEDDHDGPVALVYTRNVVDEAPAGVAVTRWKRSHELVIELHHAGTDDADVDDVADDLADAVVEALLTDAEFLTQYEPLERIERSTGVPDAPSGRARLMTSLSTTLTYRVDVTPDDATTPLETIGLTVAPSDPADAPSLEAEVTLEQE